MKNFYDFYEAANTHRGLYRIWVPLHDDAKAPLVCIRIDPSMTGFESEPCPEDSDVSTEGDSCANWRAPWNRSVRSFVTLAGAIERKFLGAFSYNPSLNLPEKHIA
jgi:hypothetical protein